MTLPGPADRDFVEFNREVGDLSIRFLCHPEHVGLANRILHAAGTAYRYFSQAYGNYPYPNITIVDSPLFNAVMEYPMLFLTGNFDGSSADWPSPNLVPADNRFPERLTMHEFGHM